MLFCVQRSSDRNDEAESSHSDEDDVARGSDDGKIKKEYDGESEAGHSEDDVPRASDDEDIKKESNDEVDEAMEKASNADSTRRKTRRKRSSVESSDDSGMILLVFENFLADIKIAFRYFQILISAFINYCVYEKTKIL